MKLSSLQSQPVLRAQTAASSVPQANSAAIDQFKSQGHEGNVHGLLGRALYGAALYGMPALAGAFVPGNTGIVTGTLLGAGIGAATHLNNSKDAAIFAATGAAVGVGLSWVGNQLQSTPYSWIPVVAGTIVGAGTQALYSSLHEN